MENYWLSKVAKYIEERITEKIELEDIADKANFSLAYFHKLFYNTSGNSIKEYIRKRRLYLAAKELQISKIDIKDISKKYQFKSSETFSRAFVKEFGSSPKKMKNKKVPKFESLDQSLFNDAEFSWLQPQIIDFKEITIIGIQSRMIPNDPRFMDLWIEFTSKIRCVESNVKRDRSFWFSKNTKFDDKLEILSFDTFVGFEQIRNKKVSNNLRKQTLKEGKYICFTHKGITKNLIKTYHYIFQKWLPNNGFEPSENEDFEIYDYRFIPNNEQSEIFIMIPVKFN